MMDNQTGTISLFYRLTALALLAVLSSIARAEETYHHASGGDRPLNEKPVEDYHEVTALFETLDYTQQSWREGRRDIPRIYLANIPQQWGKNSQHMTVNLKKQLFFRLLAPLALRQNELIVEARERAQALLQADKPLPPQDQQWLEQITQEYKIDLNDTDATLQALLERMDTLPPSLILAQAAEESGWGTSRFAFAGNALFGQWTWSGDGITPKEQREGKGNYQIARFDSPMQSVQAHALNLNTHSAYESLRELRAQKRRAGESLSGMDAAETLARYSERGEAYVETLHSIIRYNRLQAVDDATLGAHPAILLIPQHE